MMNPSTETGTPADLKNRCSKELVGSTPISGTTFNPFAKDIHKIYGPYLITKGRSKPRYQINVVFLDRTQTTMSYARWLVTQREGRRLAVNEHVDHKNEMPWDDVDKNLQILSPSENARKSSLGKSSPQKGLELGWEHGTIYAWMKRKCSCSVCSSAKQAWDSQRNSDRRLLSGSGPKGPYSKNPPHGTNAKYSRGCRCDECKKGHTDAARALRQRKAGRHDEDSCS